MTFTISRLQSMSPEPAEACIRIAVPSSLTGDGSRLIPCGYELRRCIDSKLQVRGGALGIAARETALRLLIFAHGLPGD